MVDMADKIKLNVKEVIPVGGESNVLIVSFDFDTYKINASYSQLKEALDNNKVVFLIRNDSLVDAYTEINTYMLASINHSEYEGADYWANFTRVGVDGTGNTLGFRADTADENMPFHY